MPILSPQKCGAKMIAGFDMQKHMQNRMTIACEEFYSEVCRAKTPCNEATSLNILADVMARKKITITKNNELLEATKNIIERTKKSIVTSKKIESTLQKKHEKEAQDLPSWDRVVLCIKNLRDEVHMQWHEIANLIGVSRESVRRYHKGLRPKSKALERSIKEEVRDIIACA